MSRAALLFGTIWRTFLPFMLLIVAINVADLVWHLGPGTALSIIATVLGFIAGGIGAVWSGAYYFKHETPVKWEEEL